MSVSAGIDTERQIEGRDQRVCRECKRGGCKLYRSYGSFLRESGIVCGQHVPEEYKGWYVPLVEDIDGSVWGYTSAPPDAIAHFNALPD